MALNVEDVNVGDTFQTFASSRQELEVVRKGKFELRNGANVQEDAPGYGSIRYMRPYDPRGAGVVQEGWLDSDGFWHFRFYGKYFRVYSLGVKVAE